jgi:transposase-like protein
VIVPKRKQRLGGIDQIALSLSARGWTTGEIAAHFGGRSTGPRSPRTPSAGSRKRSPLSWLRVRPAFGSGLPGDFVDAIVVKVRDGQVRNKS